MANLVSLGSAVAGWAAAATFGSLFARFGDKWGSLGDGALLAAGFVFIAVHSGLLLTSPYNLVTTFFARKSYKAKAASAVKLSEEGGFASSTNIGNVANIAGGNQAVSSSTNAGPAIVLDGA